MADNGTNPVSGHDERDGRDSAPAARVTIYWRPGCPFCMRLRLLLGLSGRRAEWVNIWSAPEASAYVRIVNDGNETVPTVVVDGTARTNPPVRWVRRALREA